ncbi:MAG: energy transducer TonB [bacterium]|nr:energy transducer TonB [bacterium]MCP4798974.1 energy transducer TonB [bacterium]
MMMHDAMNRKAATSGGFGVSIAVHGGLLLLLMFIMQMGPKIIDSAMDELNEIAYIEARYGEDVAKKVKLKTQPKVALPEQKQQEVAEVETKLPGIETRSLVKPKKTLEQKLAKLDLPKPVSRKAKMLDTDAPKLNQNTTRKPLLDTKSRLNSKKFADVEMPNVDTSNLRNAGIMSADVSSPKLSSKTTPSDLKAQNMALVGKKSKTNLENVEFEVSSGGKSKMAFSLPTGGVEGGNAALVGGSLSEGQEVYQGSVEDILVVAAAQRSQAAAADVELPQATANLESKGRRTLLDYGSGNGGTALSGRTRQSVAEAPEINAIVEAKPAEERKVVAEATPSLGGSGVSMSITGEISNRRILKSVPPEYSALAKSKGWEGVVAVHFTVMPDGKVKSNMFFEQTSAHRDLNKAAMEAIKMFIFEPLEGSLQEQWGVITIMFRLN